MYRKKGTGNPVWRFAVIGTPEELKAYIASNKKAGIANHSTEDGAPIFFSSRYALDNTELILGSDGQYFPSTAKLEAARSLTEQMGGDFGAVLGNALLGDVIGGGTSSSTSASSDDVSEESEESIESH